MLTISNLFESNLKRFIEKGKVDIPKVNDHYVKKMLSSPNADKRKKLLAAHIKLQSRINKMPSSSGI